eukprot:CAMPEP_0171547656 /NCGR_PEP_ID=MMETSP0960-20121227/5337_1 /TAXON_ID=87120 /ORGANISM="Aurantiochytrium limacinum, Strain ATCCMYA-1381" /LENGTH=129 /DNA_ID=CAMNT_0012095919 /DNA_START=314 /DNA_END=704 /DNA_ORIENTATION=-
MEMVLTNGTASASKSSFILPVHRCVRVMNHIFTFDLDSSKGFEPVIDTAARPLTPASTPQTHVASAGDVNDNGDEHTYIYIHASRVSAKVGQQAKPASALPKDQLQLPTPKCLLVHQALFLVKRAGSCF